MRAGATISCATGMFIPQRIVGLLAPSCLPALTHESRCCQQRLLCLTEADSTRRLPAPLQNQRPKGILCLGSTDENDIETTNDESNDDDKEEKPYGSRSLSWTRKYRRVVPYEKARKAVMDLGLRSKQDWDEYVQDGKKYHGPYLPSRPDEMYAQEWVSWDEFLGLMRPYHETRSIVQNVLMLQTMEEYTKFVHDNPGRAEGLRIPALPNVVYKQKGWVSFEHFFGSME